MKAYTRTTIRYQPPEESRERIRPYALRLLADMHIHQRLTFLERNRQSDTPVFDEREERMVKERTHEYVVDDNVSEFIRKLRSTRKPNLVADKLDEYGRWLSDRLNNELYYSIAADDLRKEIHRLAGIDRDELHQMIEEERRDHDRQRRQGFAMGAA